MRLRSFPVLRFQSLAPSSLQTSRQRITILHRIHCFHARRIESYDGTVPGDAQCEPPVLAPCVRVGRTGGGRFGADAKKDCERSCSECKPYLAYRSRISNRYTPSSFYQSHTQPLSAFNGLHPYTHLATPKGWKAELSWLDGPWCNPNHNPTKTARNTEHSTKYSHMSYVSREIHNETCCCTVCTDFACRL